MRNVQGDVSEAGPSLAVQMLGLNNVPQAGDEFTVFATESEARVAGGPGLGLLCCGGVCALCVAGRRGRAGDKWMAGDRDRLLRALRSSVRVLGALCLTCLLTATP
jgi:hypothetical protein